MTVDSETERELFEMLSMVRILNPAIAFASPLRCDDEIEGEVTHPVANEFVSGKYPEGSFSLAGVNEISRSTHGPRMKR